MEMEKFSSRLGVGDVVLYQGHHHVITHIDSGERFLSATFIDIMDKRGKSMSVYVPESEDYVDSLITGKVAKMTDVFNYLSKLDEEREDVLGNEAD